MQSCRRPPADTAARAGARIAANAIARLRLALTIQIVANHSSL